MLEEDAFLCVEKGEGRVKVCLVLRRLGQDYLVLIYNDNAHLGAVSVSEYDPQSGRNSVSTLTLLGHKDDALSREAAYLIGKQVRRNVSVIAGVHVDAITAEEIAQIMDNVRAGVADLIGGING